MHRLRLEPGVMLFALSGPKYNPNKRREQRRQAVLRAFRRQQGLVQQDASGPSERVRPYEPVAVERRHTDGLADMLTDMHKFGLLPQELYDSYRPLLGGSDPTQRGLSTTWERLYTEQGIANNRTAVPAQDGDAFLDIAGLVTRSPLDLRNGIVWLPQVTVQDFQRRNNSADMQLHGALFDSLQLVRSWGVARPVYPLNPDRTLTIGERKLTRNVAQRAAPYLLPVDPTFLFEKLADLWLTPDVEFSYEDEHELDTAFDTLKNKLYGRTDRAFGVVKVTVKNTADGTRQRLLLFTPSTFDRPGPANAANRAALLLSIDKQINRRRRSFLGNMAQEWKSDPLSLRILTVFSGEAARKTEDALRAAVAGQWFLDATWMVGFWIGGVLDDARLATMTYTGEYPPKPPGPNSLYEWIKDDPRFPTDYDYYDVDDRDAQPLTEVIEQRYRQELVHQWSHTPIAELANKGYTILFPSGQLFRDVEDNYGRSHFVTIDELIESEGSDVYRSKVRLAIIPIFGRPSFFDEQYLFDIILRKIFEEFFHLNEFHVNGTYTKFQGYVFVGQFGRSLDFEKQKNDQTLVEKISYDYYADLDSKTEEEFDEASEFYSGEVDRVLTDLSMEELKNHHAADTFDVGQLFKTTRDNSNSRIIIPIDESDIDPADELLVTTKPVVFLNMYNLPIEGYDDLKVVTEDDAYNYFFEGCCFYDQFAGPGQYAYGYQVVGSISQSDETYTLKNDSAFKKYEPSTSKMSTMDALDFSTAVRRKEFVRQYGLGTFR